MSWMPQSHNSNHSDGQHIVGRGKSAHRKASMASIESSQLTKAKVKAACPPAAARRRQRLSKTKSLLVTVAFIVIFTLIIAMEVLYIDETKRLDKIPETRESDVGDDGGGGSIGAQESPFAALQQKISISESSTSQIAEESAHIRAHDVPTVSKPVGSEAIKNAADNQEFNESLVKSAPSRSILAGELAAPSGVDEHYANRTAIPTTGDWQPVLGAHDKFLVYSAYLDDRQGSFIRVLAATRTRGSDPVKCAYWYDNKYGADGGDPIVVPASNKVIRENWNLKYSAMFVLCPLFVYNIGRKVAVPDHVSIIVSNGWNGSTARGSTDEMTIGNAVIGNRLPVLNRSPDKESDVVDGFAVCVKPLHYKFNHAMQLIEFIELNRILGVIHFTFYNHTIGPEVDCVLREYIRQGIVTMLPWQQLDIVSQKEIRTEGLFAAINDCLYRNMYRYRYVLMIDIDEFIVPHRNISLTAVMHESTRTIQTTKASSFSFMNSFYYLQWPNDLNSRDLPFPLISLQKTKRRAKFHPHKQRSKCIVVPRHVVEMGNHFVWEFLPGKGAVHVPSDIAYLHHYRVCEFGGDDCIRTQSVVDRSIYRYKTDLLRSVANALNNSRTAGSEHCQRRNYGNTMGR